LDNDDFIDKLLRFLDLMIPHGRAPHPHNKSHETAHNLIQAPAIRAARTSGLLALPAGPAGYRAIVPDLVRVWQIQAELVADIAALYGKTAECTREAMLYCLFRHFASHVLKEIAITVGRRVCMKRATLKALQTILPAVGVKLGQRVLRKSLFLWLPLISAAGCGAFAYYDTQKDGRTTVELCATFDDEVDCSGGGLALEAA